jgi:hypothetical protein
VVEIYPLFPPGRGPAASAPNSGFKLNINEYRLDRLSRGAPPPQRFLLAPLFPLGTVGLLFGPGGVGKSSRRNFGP